MTSKDETNLLLGNLIAQLGRLNERLDKVVDRLEAGPVEDPKITAINKEFSEKMKAIGPDLAKRKADEERKIADLAEASRPEVVKAKAFADAEAEKKRRADQQDKADAAYKKTTALMKARLDGMTADELARENEEWADLQARQPQSTFTGPTPQGGLSPEARELANQCAALPVVGAIGELVETE